MPPMSCAGAWRPRSIRCSDRPLGGGFVRWTVREPGLRPASHRSSLVRLRARELGISGVGLQAAEQNAPAFANRPLPPDHLKRGPRRTWMLESLSKNLGDIPPGDPVGDGQGIVALAHLDRSCACGGIGEESGSNDGVRQEAPSNLILGPAAPPQRIPLDEIQESGGEGPRRNSNRSHVEKPTAESKVFLTPSYSVALMSRSPAGRLVTPAVKTMWSTSFAAAVRVCGFVTSPTTISTSAASL